eukprot:TRINITY_DN10408_c0_g1_i1.p2 TRINITY_DN10408_c0_g1~~TRINITY_DN10408_c0_g1_i1.p2  ORF type:complete len:110 (+),score=5.43 TRINITY_DN10408_c0_g1_i1:1231-1560(+)
MVDLEHFVRMSKAGAFIAGDAGVVSDSVEALASALVEQVCAKPCIPAVVASLPLLSSLRRSSFDVRCVYLIFDTSRRDVSHCLRSLQACTQLAWYRTFFRMIKRIYSMT